MAMSELKSSVVDTLTAAQLLNCSDRTVSRQIANGEQYAIPLYGNRSRGGIKYAIPVSELPLEAQLKYKRMLEGRKVEDVDLVGYQERYGDEGLAQLLALQTAVEEMGLLKDTRGITLEREARAQRLGIGARMLYAYEQAYEKEGMAGLMKSVHRADKGKPRSMCEFAQDYIMHAFCSSSKPSQNVVLRNLNKIADELAAEACEVCPHCPYSLCRMEMQAKKDDSAGELCHAPGEGIKVPNRHATNRFVAGIPKGIVAAGRQGWQYWEAKYMPKTRRDKPKLTNEVWFGDHHVFDIFVLYNGKPVRPWLTAWMDAKSNALVGWVLSLNPNSDTVVEALVRGMAPTKGSPFYGVPEWIYIDNGKDYRSRRMEGDGLKEYSTGKLNADCDENSALLNYLGIGVVHAIPYRAWSKTIERVFGTIETTWIRQLPGWCGNGIDARPEHVLKDIKNEKLLTFEEFVAYWANVILPHYHDYVADDSQASPLEIYEDSEKARNDVPSWATLAIAKAMSATRKVGTTGIKLDGQQYWDGALAAYVGEDVTIRYNRTERSTITVLHDGAYVCEAIIAQKTKLVGEDKNVLEAHMRMQQTAKRGVRESLRMPKDRLQWLGGMACEIPDLAMGSTITSLVHERAYRGQQEAKAQMIEQDKSKKKAEKAASDRLSKKWAAEGAALLQGGNAG